MSSRVTHTSSSGSGKARVYREGDQYFSTPSVSSPTSSESHSSFSSSEWEHLSAHSDDIDPSESASHPPRTHRARRPEAPAAPRPAPTRRESSRYVPHPSEDPSRHRSHQHRSSRHHSHEAHSSRDRRERPEHRDREHHQSRRLPSDGSSNGTVELADEYPYGRHGAPPFPQPGVYRHGSGPIPPSHGAYPPSMPSASGYGDPYQPPGALVHRSHHDAFPYPQPGSNPFAPGPPSSNPFSPHGYANPESYFQPDSQHPQMSQHHRPQGPSHRSSLYGPAGGSLYSGSEMVPSPYGHPGMPGGMPYMMPQGYYPYPHSQHASPPPPAKSPAKEEKEPVVKEVVIEKKDESMLKEMEALRALIKQQEEERIAREKAIEAAELAKKLKAEQEAQKATEIAAASAAAKEAAEKSAADAAKAAKEESDKKLAEAEAAKLELEKKQKELEEAVAKNKPKPDMEQAPIKFKDAVGRKFSFPWHLCKTWKGMESLIKQAFLHVDVIGQHVQEGHYDLMGPDGEIILPQVWDTMIKPDWEVSMHMWPIPETPKKEKKPKPTEEEMMMMVDAHGQPIVDPFLGAQGHNMSIDEMMRLEQQIQAAEAAKASKKGKKGDKAKAGKRISAHVVDVPPMVVGGSPPAGMQPHFPAGFLSQPGDPMVINVGGGEEPPKAKTKKKKEVSGFAAWMAGAPYKPAKKELEKLERSTSKSSNSHSDALYAIPIANGNGLTRRRRSTAGSSWTTASASSLPPTKTVAAAEQGSCAVM